jgi:hypothetical protein
VSAELHPAADGKRQGVTLAAQPDARGATTGWRGCPWVPFINPVAGASKVDTALVEVLGGGVTMRKSFSVALVVLAGVSTSGNAAVAQTAAPPPDASSGAKVTSGTNQNLLDFDFVVEKLRRNYAGWETKVTDKTRPALDQLTARLRIAAQDASPEELTVILKEWVKFFDDGHVGVGRIAPAAPSASLPAGPETTPSFDWTESSVRAALAARGAGRDPLEGIWAIGDGRYRLGILPTPLRPGAFSAVVLTTTAEGWRPGQIKAELTRKADGGLDILYRAGDHGEHKIGASLLLDGAVLSLTRWGNWVREVPAIPDPGLVERALASDAMFMKPLSPDTLWLRIPDFDDSRAKPLKEILDANAAALASTANLVIDLRENGGGAD